SKGKKKQDILEIKFEDLVLSTDSTMTEIIKFISGQLRYEKKYTDVILDDDHFKHHRNVNKPILKRKIQEWEEIISKEDRKYIEQMLSFEMVKYGYKT
ncbi:MAG: hypothetical protein ACW98D_21225, partial [Promethearchaeota archaeon]